MQSLSFVIRAYNEREKLRELIESIRAQDYPQELIEIIVVDNGSSDGTDGLASEMGATVVHLAQKDFTYPKSLNLGCTSATHDILVIVSGHCLMWKTNSLRRSIRHFDDQKVAGVYGPLIPRKPYSLLQAVIGWPSYWLALLQGVQREDMPRIGILGNTNSMIRRSLWQEHQFSNAYAMGAEDFEWATWALGNGYKIIKDPAFTVRHSHNLSLVNTFKQQKFWISIKNKPRPFSVAELDYRTDIHRDTK